MNVMESAILFTRREYSDEEKAIIDLSMEQINYNEVREDVEKNTSMPERIKKDILNVLMQLEKYCLKENIPINKFGGLEIYRGLLILRVRLDKISNVYIKVDTLQYNKLTRETKGWLDKLKSSIPVFWPVWSTWGY